MRSRGALGFTLVELLTVVALIGAALVVSVVLSGRFLRGEKAPAAARALLAQVHEARQAAISGGYSSRLHLVPSSPQMTIQSQTVDPNLAGNWITLGGTMVLPTDTTLCQGDALMNLAAAAPTCPLGAPADVCFATNGAVSYSTTGACPGPNPVSGATLYITTSDDSHHYKLVIFGLTGLPRLSDQW